MSGCASFKPPPLMEVLKHPHCSGVRVWSMRRKVEGTQGTYICTVQRGTTPGCSWSTAARRRHAKQLPNPGFLGFSHGPRRCQLARQGPRLSTSAPLRNLSLEAGCTKLGARDISNNEHRRPSTPSLLPIIQLPANCCCFCRELNTVE